MKLLLDQNLPVALTHRLRDLFPVIDHVRQLGMDRSGDSDIWSFAATNSYVIVTKDSDFYYRSQVHTSPPKVVWLRVGNCPTGALEGLLQSRHAEISAFVLRLEETCLKLTFEMNAL